jgi:hypothetical protein
MPPFYGVLDDGSSHMVPVQQRTIDTTHVPVPHLGRQPLGEQSMDVPMFDSRKVCLVAPVPLVPHSTRES